VESYFGSTKSENLITRSRDKEIQGEKSGAGDQAERRSVVAGVKKD